RNELVTALRLERENFEPLEMSMILPPMGTLSLPARDARAGKLFLQVINAADVIAPRKYATVRHAGVQLERRGLADEFQLDRLPLVSKLFSNEDRGKFRE